MNFLLYDVEAAGELNAPLTYDIGGFVTSRDGTEISDSINYVIKDIFYNTEIMRTAYYADKVPQYHKEIWAHEREVKRFMQARARILQLFKEYGITAVCAHNASYDIRALNNTIRTITEGRVKYFFPYGTEVWDTLKMARQVLGQMPSYRKFCEENGYMTKHSTPRPRYTAEIIYRFITKQQDFEEAHTGLADATIELEIYKYLVRQHKKCDKTLYSGKKG